MNNRPGIFSQIWERSTLLTLIGTVMILLLVALVIVGSGLHSSLVWLILAVICIVWVFVCSCNNCKKVADLHWGRTRERSDTVSTISDLNDLNYIGYSVPMRIEEDRIWATLDLPPSYDVVSDTLEQQPPSYASAVTLLNPMNNSRRFNIPGSPTLPPPYDTLHINNSGTGACTNNDGNSEITRIIVNSDEVIRQNISSSSENIPISIISGCNVNESALKITNIDIISSQGLPTLVNEQCVLPNRSGTHIHNVTCEEEDEESSSC